MPAASRPTFLRHFGRPSRRAPDLGDMGTAFALDQSLEEAARDSHAPAAPTPRARPVAPWRLWLGRKLGA